MTLPLEKCCASFCEVIRSDKKSLFTLRCHISKSEVERTYRIFDLLRKQYPI